MDSYRRYKRHDNGGKRAFTVYINEGEIYQIEQWVSKHQHIETGGDLFGLWIDDRTAIVQFVLGPGAGCRRTSVSFYQDIEYLREAGNYLTQRHGLCNIGQWHSHHRLGLTRPSGGDEHTVWGNMPNLGLDRYIVFIATIHYEKSVTINPYLFEIEGRRRNDVLHGTFQYMKGNSPFRLNETIRDQNKIKYRAEVINSVFKPVPDDKRDKNLKRKHINENEPTENGTKQSKPEVSGSTTYHVYVETQNGKKLHNQDVKTGQRGQPNSLQGENVGRNVQDNSITPALDQGDDKKIDIDSDSCSTSDLQKEDEQNSSQSKSTKEGSDEPGKEEDQAENENHGEQVASDHSEGDQMRQPDCPGNGNEVENETTTQGSKVVDEQNNAGDKDQVEKKDDELLDGGEQPDRPRDDSKIHDDSIMRRSHEDDEDNSAGDKDHVQNESGEHVDDVVEDYQSANSNSLRDDSKIHDDSIAQGSLEDDEQNSAGDKDQVEKKDDKLLEGGGQPDSPRDDGKIHDDSITQGSNEDNEQNNAKDKGQIKNEDGEQADEILKDNKTRQTNSPRGDSKVQLDSVTQGSHEDDEKHGAGDKDQVKNLDGGQSGSDGFEHQKKEKKTEKSDDQFSTNHVRKVNEQNNSHGSSAGKNLDDLDSNDRNDQNVEANVPDGVPESHFKQNFDESSQYKMTTTQGIDHTEFERFEEKERESDKDNATVNDNHLSNPESKDEEMQTDVDVRNEKGSPKTTQPVEGGDDNETQVETMDVDSDIFSSSNEPAKVDQGTFEMETESTKEPTRVNEMNCEIPPMSIPPEEATDPNKNQQTQDRVMSIEEDSQTQGNDDNESKKLVHDEEIENKISENIPSLQNSNDHNADENMIDSEENNPTAKPIEDEHSFIFSTQNGNAKKGLISETAVNEPEGQDSCIIPLSKMDTDVPTSNINDKPSKMSNKIPLDSKQSEDATCLHNEQSVENQEKHDSVEVRNSNSNENVESDSISNNPKQKKTNLCNFDKEVTLLELQSSDSTVLKKNTTSNNGISINEPATNAASEESNSEQIKETEATSSDQMADQNKHNAHGNIVQHLTIGRKIESSANEYPQSSAKDQLAGGNEENNHSQSMHWDFSNKDSSNRPSRSIFDRPESPDDVAKNVEVTAVPGEGIASASTDEEAKLERKNSQDDHLELKSKQQDLLEFESQLSVENVCDIELPSFEGTDPETDKVIKNENQSKENPGVSAKIEAKNDTVDDPTAQKQQEKMEQIESIPESETKRRNKKRKMKMPKTLKRMLGKKNKRDKSEKKKGILRRLFKKKSNKISESKKEKTSTEASTMSASGNNDSAKNTVTNKTKDEGIEIIEVIENNEGVTGNNSQKVAKKGKVMSKIWKKKKKESKKTSEFIDCKDRDTLGNTKEESSIETSKKKKKDGKKEGEGKKKGKRGKTKNKNKKGSKLVKGKDGDTDENIRV